MSRFLARVRGTIREHALLAPGDRVLVGLSGGPDSVALTHALVRVAPEQGAAVVAVAHVHHGLRGADADQDEAFCRALAARLGLPIVVERVDVAGEARRRRISIEQAGHDLRLACLERARDAAGATVIALGHTRDDQAETYLLRLLRGAGSRGLAGMYPRTGRLVRPLLDVSRVRVLRYLASHGLACREDASNRDLSVPRNRVRHVILPPLVRALGPHLPRTLARNAALARDDEGWLSRSATEAAERIVLYSGPSEAAAAAIDRSALLELHRALARRVLRQALERLAGGRFIGWSHVRAVERLALAPRPDGRIALPGARALRRGGRLVIEAAPADSDPEGRLSPLAGPVERARAFRYALEVPGRVAVAEAGLVVSAEARPGGPEWPGRVSNPLEAVLDAAALGGRALVVRGRRPGDRLQPLGAPGTRKLQDVLVDRKVPRGERARVPVVTTAAGAIAWVVGHVVAEPFRVSAETTGVVFLKATPGEEGLG